MIDCLREDAGEKIGEMLKDKGIEYIVEGRIITPAPWTLPSMVSFFSRTYPNVHKIHAGNFYITDFKEIKNSIYSLNYWFAEEIYKKNIPTVGISTNIILSEYYGFNRGFKEFVTLPYAKTGRLYERINKINRNKVKHIPDKDITQIRKLISNFVNKYSDMYLFSVIMNLHEPYYYNNKKTLNKAEILTLPPEDRIVEINKIKSAYYSSLEFLLKKLYKMIRDIEDESIIILFGDHGQALGEHGYVFHQSFLYDELIKSYAIIIDKNEEKIKLDPPSYKKDNNIFDLISLGRLTLDVFQKNKTIKPYHYFKLFSKSFSYGTSHTPDYLPLPLYNNYLNNKYHALVFPKIKLTISTNTFEIKQGEYFFYTTRP